MCNDRIWTLLTRKLTGEATSTELRELELLLSTLPGNNASVDKVADIWHISPRHDNDFMEATYLAHVERMKEKGVAISSDVPELEPHAIGKKPSPSKVFSLKNLAFILVLFTAGWVILSSKKSADTVGNRVTAGLKEIETKKGSRTKLQLPDGSNVWLNAGSKLHYDKNFDGPQRVVYLTGEAFFDVVKNAKKPFIIHTSKIDVRVLGTQFNVKAYDEDKTTETSLIRGSVEVFLKNNPSKKYLLHPNEKLVLNNDTELPKSLAVAERKQPAEKQIDEPRVAIQELKYLDNHENVESSWTRNILSFDDEPFSEVAKKMERWYNVTIEFKNNRWEEKYLSGSFESETLDQALAALKFTTGFKFTINGETVSIY